MNWQAVCSTPLALMEHMLPAPSTMCYNCNWQKNL